MQLDKQMQDEIDKYLELVKNRIQEIISPIVHHDELKKTLEHALSTNGKMIRPILMRLCAGASLTEQQYAHLIDAAAAVEIIHTASLVHDDIVDDAPLRRGKDSVQSQYGKCEAVYTGDYLIARAVGHLTRCGYSQDATVLLECVCKMCDGEVIQLSNRTNTNVEEQEYLKAVSGKTATLFETACFIGARIAGLSQAQSIELFSYGHFIGMMFQMRDDLIDWVSTKDNCGKPVNEDFSCGIFTLPAIYTFTSRGYSDELRKVYEKVSGSGINAELSEEARTIVSASGGIDYTVSKLLECGVRAKKFLSCHSNDDYKMSMIAIVDELCTGIR